MDNVPLTSDRSRTTTKLGVRLIGLPDSSTSTKNKQTTFLVEEWVRKLLHENDLLQHRNGNPVTQCRRVGPDVYVEFRCEEEHRRFLRMRQEYFHDRRIRICKWLDDFPTEAQDGHNDEVDIEIRTRKKIDSLGDFSIPSKRRRTVDEKTQLPGPRAAMIGPTREQYESRIPFNLAIRLYCPLSEQTDTTILSMISDVTIIMRQEGFLQQNEDAVDRYWFESGKPVAVLQAKSEELASKMCLCNGRRSATDGILYRLARDRKAQQDPIDWFSYYQSRYGRPWAEGLTTLRVAFLHSSTREMVDLFTSRYFLANSHGKKKIEQLLCRKARESWQEDWILDGHQMVKSFNIVHLFRVGYHFLLEATSNDAASAFASLDHDATIDEGKLILRIQRCCKTLQVVSSNTFEPGTTKVSRTSSATEPESPSREENNEKKSENTALTLVPLLCSEIPPSNLVIRMFHPTSSRPDNNTKSILSMMYDLTMIMRQEGFLQQDASAVARYSVDATRPIVVMETNSSNLASKICVCNGRFSPVGILYRLARDRNHEQDPMDWFSYYQSRYGRPCEGGLQMLRVIFLVSSTMEMLKASGWCFSAGLNDKKKIQDWLCRKARTNWQNNECLDRPMIGSLHIVHTFRVGYHVLLEGAYNDATSALAALDGMTVDDGRLIIRIRRCYEPLHAARVDPTNDLVSCSVTGPEGCSRRASKDDFERGALVAPPPLLARNSEVGSQTEIIVRMFYPHEIRSDEMILSMICDLTRIMREEGFLQQDETAIGRYFVHLRSPTARLELKTANLASKVCLCNGRSSPSGILYRLAWDRAEKQNHIDWFAYYQSRYDRPWKGGIHMMRVTFLHSSTMKMMLDLCSSSFSTNLFDDEKKIQAFLTCNAKDLWKGDHRTFNGRLIKTLLSVHDFHFGYHFLVEAAFNDAASALAALDGMTVDEGRLILRVRRCYESCESKQVSTNSIQLAATATNCGDDISTQGCEGMMRSDYSTHLRSEAQGTTLVMPPSHAKGTTTPLQGCDDNDSMRNSRDCSTTISQSALSETQSAAAMPSQVVKSDTDSAPEEEGSVAEISVNDRQQDSAKDKEIALLRDQLEKATSKLEQSKMQTTTIHDDWKAMKIQEKERGDKLKNKEAQFVQLSESLSLLTRQQLKDRQHIQELTEKLKETNDKLRSSSLGMKS